jgi:hypothetical protein
MALFCEDIREEKNDTVTLIGILPDTVNVGEPPNPANGPISGDSSARALTKLGIYTRVNFDPRKEIKEIDIRLILPNEQAIDLGKIGADVIKKSKDEAIARGNPLAGVIGRAVAAGFQIPKFGVVKLEVTIDGKAHLGAALNFRKAPEVTSSNDA